MLAIGESAAQELNSETPMLAWLAVDLGRVSAGQGILAGLRSRRWSTVAQAILAGEAARAADLLCVSRCSTAG